MGTFHPVSLACFEVKSIAAESLVIGDWFL